MIVAFAILFIATLSNIFGTENTPMAVVLFCILLGIRFVNFEYCIGDSLVTLAIAFATLLFVPAILISVPTIPVSYTHLDVYKRQGGMLCVKNDSISWRICGGYKS